MITFRHAASPVVAGLKGIPGTGIAVVETPSGGSVANSAPTIGDATWARVTTTSAANACMLDVGELVKPATFTSNTPSVCTVDATGQITVVTTGSGIIDVVTQKYRSGFTRTFTANASVLNDTFTEYVAGSLGEYVTDAILAMIAGKSASSTTQNVLSSSSGGSTTPNHIRNPDLFTGALDLSAISVWTSSTGSNKFPVVLLSPMHVIAGHVGTTPGQTVVFKAPNGTYEVRTIVSQLRIDDPVQPSYVGLLSAAINSITPMALLPADTYDKAPSWNTAGGAYGYINTPVLVKLFTGGDTIRIMNFRGQYNSYGGPADEAYVSTWGVAPYQEWTKYPIGGDSNGPVFLPINGNPVLVTCLHTPAGGTSFQSRLADIQAKMNTLVAGQTVPVADLSAFPSY